MEIVREWILGLESINPSTFLLSFLSILPWGFFLYLFQPSEHSKKFKYIFWGLFLGYLSTVFILALHPILWPQVNFKPKRVSMLSFTVHMAFIQAGVMEETFKSLMILLLGYFAAFNKHTKNWDKDIVLAGGFVALGFAWTENYSYISKDTTNIFSMFLGRFLYSSNIHLLINLCFALFVLKSNNLNTFSEKAYYIFKGFLLAIFQHGVVDFFLIPSSKFGLFLSVSMFMGIWVWVVRDLRKYVYFNEIFISNDEDTHLIESKVQLEN
jgi:RsiW-degrading membrane proteinase PrsW (M82 family)